MIKKFLTNKVITKANFNGNVTVTLLTKQHYFQYDCKMFARSFMKMERSFMKMARSFMKMARSFMKMASSFIKITKLLRIIF